MASFHSILRAGLRTGLCLHRPSVLFTLAQFNHNANPATKVPWGSIDGVDAHKFVLKNSSGLTVTLTDYGATILSVTVPQKDGQVKELTLNYWDAPNVSAWAKLDPPFYGVVAGRYANRIAKGQFTLDGVKFQLPAINNGPNHLHGGAKGFDKHVWTHSARAESGAQSVRFTLQSPDGEEGYPGTLNAAVIYTLNAANQLSIKYEAETDKPTPINLTNHTYWNLSGARGAHPQKILDHVLRLNCSHVLPVDDVQIPTGELKAVNGTAFDFRKPKPIGQDIASVDGGGEPGYDHCFVIDRAGKAKGDLVHCASATADGVTMDVSTTQPGVQLYTGNFLQGTGPHVQHGAFCLETQHYPDTPNKDHFPTAILHPEEQFKEETVHTFEF